MSIDKVSVISACYNHGEFVEEMVQSVFNQTLPVYEIIIVDDGSDKRTREILSILRDARVRVILQNNKGPAQARNLAISHANGDIIMNLDADDKVAPTFIERCVEQFQLHPEAGIIYSDVHFFGERSGLFDLPPFSLRSMLEGNCIVADACFRKQDWKVTGGYSSELTYGYEDYDFWLSILELGREVYKIEEPLVYYRTYADPELSRSGRRKKYPVQVHAALVQAFVRHRELFRTVPDIFQYYSYLEDEYRKRNLSTGLIPV